MMIDIVVDRRAAEHGAVILVMQLQFADDAAAIMDQRTILEVAIAVIGVDRLRQTLAFEAEHPRGLAWRRWRRHAVQTRPDLLARRTDQRRIGANGHTSGREHG